MTDRQLKPARISSLQGGGEIAGEKMNGGRQSSALLSPLLVVWVVHSINSN